jgi:ferredoxin-NADP reductase
MMDKNEKRQVKLLYSNATADDIAYADLFTQAQKQLGIETFYTLTDKTKIPAGWVGGVGIIDERMVRSEVPDYMERTFYISGPQVMVTAFDQMLKKMGIKNKDIKKDFFPGFA